MNVLKPLSLRGNFTWTMFGNLVYSLCSWVTLTAIAKIGSPTMVGQFALGLAITQPIIAFSQLSLNQVQATDARREYRFWDYLGLRLITNTFALLIFAGVALFGNHAGQTSAVIAIIGLGFVFDAIGDITFGLFRQHERMDRIAISMGAEGILSLLLLLTGLVWMHSIIWAAAGSTLASALVVLAYDVPNAIAVLKATELSDDNTWSRWSRFMVPLPRWDIRMIGKLAWVALPLGTIMMLISLNSNISRYFVGHSLGVHELGIFSALVSFVAVGRLLTTALGLSASPRLANHYADRDRTAFTGLLNRLLLIGTLLALAAPFAAMLFGRRLLTVFYTREYSHYADVFVLYLAAGGIDYIAGFVGYAITAARFFKAQAASLAAATVVTAGTSAWLIPAYGLRGAAWTAMIVAASQLAGNLLILRHAVHKLAALPVETVGGWSGDVAS